jgi:hypothetical protein
MAPRVKGTSEHQVIQLADGFPKRYNEEKKTHEVSCDMCREILEPDLLPALTPIQLNRVD